MIRYIPLGVRGWTDISDAARTRVLGFLGMQGGLGPSDSARDIDLPPDDEQPSDDEQQEVKP